MKFSKLGIIGSLGIVGTLLMTAPAVAEDESSDWSITGNVAITNDYVYRGFTQSNEGFALQGGLDIAHSSGFYVGVWGSNVEFNDATEQENGSIESTSIEIDIYGGFGGDFGNSMFSYDVGVIYYMYPDDPKGSEQNFVEFGGSLGADAGFASFSAGFWYSPDFYGGIGDAIYIPLGIEVPVPMGNETFSLSLSANVGFNKYLDVEVGDDSYVNWDIGATISIDKWFDVDLRYYDTDGTKEDCRKICDARFVAAISREF